MDERLLLRIKEVCELTALGRSTVYGLLDRPGGLPTIRVGRARRVPAAAVREWIQRRVDAADAEELP
jgi:excisionase family DNA binding protein